MLNLHRKYMDLNTDAIYLGLRAAFLTSVCAVIFVLSKTTNLSLFFAILGIFVVSVIEVMSLNTHTIRRLKFGVLISISAGIATFLGSFFGQHFIAFSVGLIIFMCLVGLSCGSNRLISGSILFIADLYIIGSSGVTDSFFTAFFYGLSFMFGGLALVLFTYLQWKVIPNQGDTLELEPINKYIEFHFTQSNIAFAIRLAIAVFSANALAYIFKVPQPYWVAMTSLLILKIDHELSWNVIRHRFFGTLWGSILAATVIFVVQDRLTLALLIFPTMFLIVVSLARHYGAYVFFLTALVTILFNLVDFSGLLITRNRIEDTLLGVSTVIVVIAVSRFFKRKQDENAEL